MKNAKLKKCQEKRHQNIYQISGGTSPADLWIGGTRSPLPPAFNAHEPVIS